MLKNGLLKNVEDLVKNKIVLYVIFFFALANTFGYLATNNYEAFIFFTLVLFVSKEFTNHIGLALLCSMTSTNLLISIVQGRRVYESFVSGMDHDGDGAANGGGGGGANGGGGGGANGGGGGANGGGGGANRVVKDEDAESFKNDVDHFNKLETMLSHQEGLVSSLDRIDKMIGQLSVMSSSVAAKEHIAQGKQGKQRKRGLANK